MKTSLDYPELLSKEETCFEVWRHRYIGATTGYIEVLEVKNPPKGKWPIVIHMFDLGNNSTFFECKSVEEACKYTETFASILTMGLWYKVGKEPKLRKVKCNKLAPW